MDNEKPNPALTGFLANCKADNNPAISLIRNKDGVDVVRLHEPQIGKFEVHFPEGRQPEIIIGRPGRSGWEHYKSTSDNLSKISKAVASKPTGAGVLISQLGRAFGLQNCNVSDSRGDDFSTSKNMGAQAAMVRIHDALSKDRLGPFKSYTAQASQSATKVVTAARSPRSQFRPSV